MLTKLSGDEYWSLAREGELWVSEGEPVTLPDQEVDKPCVLQGMNLVGYIETPSRGINAIQVCTAR